MSLAGLRPAADGTWDSAWHDALSALELDVADTEAMLVRLHTHAEWVPPVQQAWQLPQGLGAMPASLAGRARALVERQQRAAVELTRAMVGSRRQQRAAASMESRSAAPPVYIDTAV